MKGDSFIGDQITISDSSVIDACRQIFIATSGRSAHEPIQLHCFDINMDGDF